MCCGVYSTYYSLSNDGFGTNVRAIACDEQTAILLEPSGAATLRSQATGPTHVCYFFSTVGLPEVCKPNTPLTFTNITVFRATPTVSSFDFVHWVGTDGTSYTIDAKDGQLTSSQPGGAVY